MRTARHVTVQLVQFLHHKWHATSIRQLGLLAQPEAVLDCECVDGN